MAKIIKFKHGRIKLWAVWMDGKNFLAVDITGKGKNGIISALPNPTPNYICQFGVSQQDAISQVKKQEMEALL